MKALQHIWADIRKGENIDLYVTIALAVLITILNVIGVTSQSFVISLLLITLALLSYSMLGNRHQVQSAIEKLAQTAEEVFKKKWSEDEWFRDIGKANDILMIGVSLRRTVRNNYSFFEEKLKHGAYIRVLLLDPNSTALDMAANRTYANVDVDRTRNGVNETIKSLCSLGISTGGKIEIRIINYPLSIGGFILDADTLQGALYLEYYTYKMRGEDLPKLVLHIQDGYWYEFFRSQAKALWESGTTYSLLPS